MWIQCYYICLHQGGEIIKLTSFSEDQLLDRRGVGKRGIGYLDAQLSDLGGNVWFADNSDDIIGLYRRPSLWGKKLGDDTSTAVNVCHG